MLAEYRDPGPTLNSDVRFRAISGEGMVDLGGEAGAEMSGEPYEGGGDWGRWALELER